MDDRLAFLNEALPWGDKPVPALVAVHLLVCVLADRQGEAVELLPRLAALLGVNVRTIYSHVETLIEGGRLRGRPGRLQLPHLAPPRDLPTRSPDLSMGSGSILRSHDQKIDPTIKKIDPRINLAASEINSVAVLTAEAKRSEARPASLAEAVDRVLDRACAYVPESADGQPRSVLVGRAIQPDCKHTRWLVAQVLERELKRGRGRDLDTATAVVVGYVDAYAAICEQDPQQRRFWSEVMFSLEVKRRKAPWDVVTSTVDRARLPVVAKPSARFDGAVTPARYGQGTVDL